MRLYGDCNGANLGHTVLWRILRVFVEDALSLMRLRPELFEESIVDPSISRSGERFCEDAAFGDGLIFLGRQVVRLRYLDRWQRLPWLNRGWQRRRRRRRRWRWLLDRLGRRRRRNRSRRTFRSRCHVPAFVGIFNAGRSPRGELPLLLHRVSRRFYTAAAGDGRRGSIIRAPCESSKRLEGKEARLLALQWGRKSRDAAQRANAMKNTGWKQAREVPRLA